MPREYTEEEVRQQFLEVVWTYINYWENQPRSSLEKLEGLAFSMLVILDGGTSLPGFTVSPCPHPDDKEYLQSLKENWYPSNCDIAGVLHELFHAVGKTGV